MSCYRLVLFKFSIAKPKEMSIKVINSTKLRKKKEILSNLLDKQAGRNRID